MFKKIKFVFIFLALALVFFNVYYPHINYPLPLHVDEWQHLAQSVQIMDKGSLVNENPYFLNVENRDLEPGFHIFIAKFFSLTRLDPVLNYRFFPAIFAVLAALVLFIFIYRMTNFWIALLSIIFFSILPSNVNILGLIFFVPLTLGIFFIYLFFLLFKTNKKIIALIILLALFFIHPPSGLILLPFILFYYLTSPDTNKLIKKYIKKYKIIAISTPILFLFFIFFFRDFILKIIKTILSGGLFPTMSSVLGIRYFLPSLYGKLSICLAIIGGFIGFRKKLKDFVLWVFFILILIGSTYIFTYFKIIPFLYTENIYFLYQRLIYYFMIGLVPLSAVGFYFLIKSLSKLKINKTLIKICSIVVSCLLLFFIFFEYSEIYKYTSIDSPYTKTYHLIEKEEYEDIKWLSNLPKGIVIAPRGVSTTIYPISKHKVVGIIEGQLGGGNIHDTDLFFTDNTCTLKERLIKKHNVNFVFSKEKIDCKNLEEIYSKNNYIYKVI